MVLLILFFVLSIAFSFLCSVLEAVLLSITPTFIRKQEGSRPKLYRDLNYFKSDIDRPLSAILTLNTIAHTVGAIGVGAQATKIFSDNDLVIMGMHLSAEGIIATVMTLAILILSEIIPKTIGANNWKRLAPTAVVTLKLMIKILAPLVWLSQRITKGLKKQKDKSVLTRADLLAMTDAVSRDGILDSSEKQVIENVLNLPRITIQDIMTPRNVMYTVHEEETLNEIKDEERFQQFSRIPIFDEEKEKVVGMVLKSDILSDIIEGKGEEKVESIKREVSFVREDVLLADFFKQTYRKRQHLYIVEDQYGSITGLITLEDVLETILGYEIVDETDAVADLQRLVKEQKKEAGMDPASSDN
jgi:CBS domain containing-hemolysin-like protein